MTLDFFASMTAAPSDFRKIETLLKVAESSNDPLAHMLTTPLFMGKEALSYVQRFQEEGRSEVCFDSAGYYVQMGKIGYHELYMKLLNCYQMHRWADRYVLPDNVPLSSDSSEQVEEKVRETVHYSCLFFEEMPDELKEKAMPVVHGRTQVQVEYCLEHYLKLGVKWVGFGSFGTFGKNNEANMATTSTVENARQVVQIASRYGVKVFTRFKQITDHSCPFCQDYHTLAGHKMHRVIHNLLAVNESVDILNQGQFERARAIYAQGSLKYREEYKQWLPLTQG